MSHDITTAVNYKMRGYQGKAGGKDTPHVQNMSVSSVNYFLSHSSLVRRSCFSSQNCLQGFWKLCDFPV